MRVRRSLLMVPLIVIGTGAVVGGVVAAELHGALVRQQRRHLLGVVQRRAGLVEALAETAAGVAARGQGDRLSGLLGTVDPVDHTGTLLVAQTPDGRLLPAGPGVPPEENTSTPLAEPLRRALAGRSGTMTVRDGGGRPMLVAYGPVRGLGWGVAAAGHLPGWRVPLCRAVLTTALLALVLAAVAARLVIRAARPPAGRLGENEATLRSIFRAAPVGIGLVSARRFGRVNDRLCQMLGYRARELTHRSVRMLYESDEEFERIGAEHYGSAHTSGTSVGETRWLHKDGSIRDILLSTTPVTPDDSATGYTFVAQDITDRKQAEHRLRESEQFLQCVFDAIRDGVAVLDRELNIVRVNPWMEWMYAARMPLVGRKCHEVLRNRSTPCPGCPCVPALETGDGHSEVIPYPSAEEPTRWIELSAFPLRDTQGEVIGIIEHVKDITARKRMEDALRRSERIHRIVSDSASDCIYWRSPSGSILYISPACERLTGHTREEFLRTPELLNGIIHPDHRAEWSVHNHAALQDGSPAPLQLRIVTKSGQTRWIAHICHPLRDRSGAFLGIRGVHRDITESKLAEQLRDDLTRELAESAEELTLRNEELQRAKTEMETFMYAVSHDLRGPLINLQGFAARLERSVSRLGEQLSGEERGGRAPGREVRQILEQDVPEAMGSIHDGVGRLDALIEGLLSLSRTGRQELHFACLDMRRLARRVVSVFGRTIEEQGVTVHIGQMPPAIGDETAIDRVLSNLVGNALKYLDPTRAGRIEIGFAGLENGRHRYFVRDNGIGIEEHNQQRIFRMFHRLRKSDAPGEGLGLAIVEKLIERHDGRVEVESRPGSGSVFSFTLEAVADAAVRSAVPPACCP